MSIRKHSAPLRAKAFAKAVGDTWSFDDLQIEVKELGESGISQVASSRVFFDAAIVEAFGKIASEESPIHT